MTGVKLAELGRVELSEKNTAAAAASLREHSRAQQRAAGTNKLNNNNVQIPTPSKRGIRQKVYSSKQLQSSSRTKQVRYKICLKSPL